MRDKHISLDFPMHLQLEGNTEEVEVRVVANYFPLDDSAYIIAIFTQDQEECSTRTPPRSWDQIIQTAVHWGRDVGQ